MAMNRNEKARATAIKAGKDLFSYEVLDYVPACTACGKPIHKNLPIKLPGLWRGCDCPDIVWQCSATEGWKKWNKADVPERPTYTQS